jgi:hypothetical protein
MVDEMHTAVRSAAATGCGFRRHLATFALLLAWISGPGFEASHVFEHVAEHQRAHELGDERHHDLPEPASDGARVADSETPHGHAHPEKIPAVSHKAPAPNAMPPAFSVAELDWPPLFARLEAVPRAPVFGSRAQLSHSGPRAPPVL